MSTETAFAEWAILELMGHRRLAGYVTEQQIGGSGFLRIDIPSNDGGDDATQLTHEQEMSRKIPIGHGKVALVDADDYDAISEYHWYLVAGKYAGRRESKRLVYMHRQILAEPDAEVDHINGNGLDNRRDNLRVAEHAENIRNQRHRTDGTSRFRGVFWDKRRSAWVAKIKVSYRAIHLGQFQTEMEAAHAYDRAAQEHFGAFARTNFVTTQFVSPSAVYAITPTSEATARRVALLAHPAPVQRWELPPAPEAEPALTLYGAFEDEG